MFVLWRSKIVKAEEVEIYERVFMIV